MNARRIVSILVGILAVFSIGGLITTAVIGVSGDKYNDYGEIPIPGSGVIALPAGEVTVNFHADRRGKGLAVPPLHMNIEPPSGAPDPKVNDELGGSVTVNDEIHRQVWVMQVDQPGKYQVSIAGPVGDVANPRLAFGRTTRVEGPLWIFAALSMISVDLGIALWWLGRRQATAPKPVSDPYAPSDEGVRLEQLKTIAALRDSGAMTEKEFQAEKRRILEGG
ncbi:MAG: SHOCT domain-containing protein [Mycobacterium sp.]